MEGSDSAGDLVDDLEDNLRVDPQVSTGELRQDAEVARHQHTVVRPAREKTSPSLPGVDRYKVRSDQLFSTVHRDQFASIFKLQVGADLDDAGFTKCGSTGPFPS